MPNTTFRRTRQKIELQEFLLRRKRQRPGLTDDSHEAPRSPFHPEETIRVGVEQLDNVIRLIGEIAVSHRKSNHNLSVLKELQRIARAHVKQLHHILQEENALTFRQNAKTDPHSRQSTTLERP